MFDDIEKELGVYPEVSREELKEFKQQEFNKKQKTLRKNVSASPLKTSQRIRRAAGSCYSRIRITTSNR